MIEVKKYFSIKTFALCGLVCALCFAHAANGAVAQRAPAKAPAGPTAASAKPAAGAARPSVAAAAARTPTIKAGIFVPEEVVEEIEEIAAEPEPISEPPIENRAGEFSALFEEASVASTQSSAFADTIRAQRDAIAAQESAAQRQVAAANMVAGGTAASNKGGNACDNNLRACMRKTCGDEKFSKCALDSDSVWGGKMETCRRDAKCTGHEFMVFAAEMKDDRDVGALLARFDTVIDCGKRYNECISEKCGNTSQNARAVTQYSTGFTKCLSKAGGDRAIAECASIAKQCTEADNGLPARMMTLFGNLRGDAEKRVAEWEQELYKLRAQIQSECQAAGGLFDQRSFECVFTAEFWTKQNETAPMAVRQIAPNVSFACTEEWFGINVTNADEEAARKTQAAAGTNAALMGAGAGVLAGAFTSGAMQRTADRRKAGSEACEAQGGQWQKILERCKCPGGQKWSRKNASCSMEPECKNDKDCENNATCTAGECVDKTPGGGGNEEEVSPPTPVPAGPTQKEQAKREKQDNKAMDKQMEKNHSDKAKAACQESKGRWVEGGTCDCDDGPYGCNKNETLIYDTDTFKCMCEDDKGTKTLPSVPKSGFSDAQIQQAIDNVTSKNGEKP